MSISIATNGMVTPCCIRAGGAPPYRQNIYNEQKMKVQITNVEMTTKDSKKSRLTELKVKLVDIE